VASKPACLSSTRTRWQNGHESVPNTMSGASSMAACTRTSLAAWLAGPRAANRPPKPRRGARKISRVNTRRSGDAILHCDIDDVQSRSRSRFCKQVSTLYYAWCPQRRGWTIKWRREGMFLDEGQSLVSRSNTEIRARACSGARRITGEGESDVRFNVHVLCSMYPAWFRRHSTRHSWR
jgi:hypothetical protein